VKFRRTSLAPHKGTGDDSLTHASNATRPGLNAFVLAACVYSFIGRLLLIAISISLITMPLTQHVWTWDRFLHGGHDFEFGMLTILTTLSLVLLLAQLCKQGVGLLLSAFCRLSCYAGEDSDIGLSYFHAAFPVSLFSAREMSCLSFPLQI
jgi:hypothetical protein